MTDTKLSANEVEKIILSTEVAELSDRGDKVWPRRMAVALADRLNPALSTSYRQGLEDAAKGLDLDEILGITEYLLEQAAIEWPDEGQPECDSDGLCGQRVCDEVGCVVSKYRRVRALKDNPNG